jgi:hypothetical protein
VSKEAPKVARKADVMADMKAANWDAWMAVDWAATKVAWKVGK